MLGCHGFVYFIFPFLNSTLDACGFVLKSASKLFVGSARVKQLRNQEIESMKCVIANNFPSIHPRSKTKGKTKS